jgi:hypothetical protein
VLNCLIGLTPFVDNFTHLGGMVYGFLCGLSTIDRLQTSFFGFSKDTCAKIRGNLLRFAGLIVSVVLIMTTTIILAQSDGTTSPCSSCRYISCVPFPPWSEGRFEFLLVQRLLCKSYPHNDERVQQPNFGTAMIATKSLQMLVKRHRRAFTSTK